MEVKTVGAGHACALSLGVRWKAGSIGRLHGKSCGTGNDQAGKAGDQQVFVMFLHGVSVGVAVVSMMRNKRLRLEPALKSPFRSNSGEPGGAG